MIWASAPRLFLIRNLLDPAGEKILLMNPVNRGGDYHPGLTVHDRHKIEESTAHRQVGDVHALDLVRAVRTQPPQQVEIDAMPESRHADVRLLINRHQPDQAHEPTDALLVHLMALVAQALRHLTNAEEQRVQ
jgi:hypothetical protein